MAAMQGSGWMPGKTEAPSSSHFQECPPALSAQDGFAPGSAWLSWLQRHRWTRILHPQEPGSSSLHLASCQGRGQKAKAFLPHKQGKGAKRPILFCLFFFRGTCFLLHLQNYFQRVLPTFSSHLSKTEYFLSSSETSLCSHDPPGPGNQQPEEMAAA